jgi:hypothetical protein
MAMATSSPSAPLNAEPSRRDQRVSQGLQPKSYVDAVLEDPTEAGRESVNGTSSPNSVNGTNSASYGNRTTGSTTGSGQGASILRIVQMDDDTAGSSSNRETNGSYTSGAEQGGQEKRPGAERQESKHEYYATVRTK